MEALWEFGALLAHLLGLYRNWGLPGDCGENIKMNWQQFLPHVKLTPGGCTEIWGSIGSLEKSVIFPKPPVLGLYLAHNGWKGYKRVEHIPEQYYCVCLMIMVCTSMAPFLGFQGWVCHKVCSPLLLCCGEEAGRKLVESTGDGVGRMYLNLVASVCHGRWESWSSQCFTSYCWRWWVALAMCSWTWSSRLLLSALPPPPPPPQQPAALLPHIPSKTLLR